MEFINVDGELKRDLDIKSDLFKQTLVDLINHDVNWINLVCDNLKLDRNIYLNYYLDNLIMNYRIENDSKNRDKRY